MPDKYDCRTLIIHNIYRNADEKWYSRFSKTAKENYHEMGLLSFSVVSYTSKNGQLIMDVYVL
jgi:hypothetical protein